MSTTLPQSSQGTGQAEVKDKLQLLSLVLCIESDPAPRAEMVFPLKVEMKFPLKIYQLLQKLIVNI